MVVGAPVVEGATEVVVGAPVVVVGAAVVVVCYFIFCDWMW